VVQRGRAFTVTLNLLARPWLQDNWTPGSPAQNRSRFAVGDVTSGGLAALRSTRGRCPQASVLRSGLGPMHDCLVGVAAISPADGPKSAGWS
jgi:hypothetical protein